MAVFDSLITKQLGKNAIFFVEIAVHFILLWCIGFVQSSSARPVSPIAVVDETSRRERNRRSSDDEPATARVVRGAKRTAKLV